MKRLINFFSRNKKWAISISAFLVIIIGAFLTIFIMDLSKQEELAETVNIGTADISPKNNDPIPAQIESDNEKVNVQQLIALDNNEYGISPTSAFKLTTMEATTEDDIKKALFVVPEKSFSIETVSSQEHIIKFDSAFEQNSIIKMKYNNGEVSDGWAFQTQKIFGIAATSPSDGVINAPVNSSIEIYFTKDAPKNIDKYFSIAPEVSGSFKYDHNKVIFIPDKDLINGNQYTVTIGKGYGDKNECLNEDYIFTFKPERNYNINTFDFYDMDAVLKQNQQLIKFYVNKSQSENLTVKLNIYSIKDANTYIDGLNYIYSREESSQPFYNILSIINYSEVATVNTKIQTIEDDNDTNYFLELPEALASGYYLLEVIKNDIKVYQFAQVSKYQAYVAVTDDELLAWVIDSDEAKPAQGFETELDGNILGYTNSDGLMVASLKNELDTEKNWYPIITDLQGQTFVANLKAYSASSYYYNYYNKNKKKYWSYLYTDRNAYLPTDTINTFGFVQKIKSQTPSQVDVKLVYNDTILDSKKVNLSEIGSFNCQFNLKNYLYPYIYIEVYDGDDIVESKTIQVCYFEKPTYKIETDLDKEFVLSGDTIDVTAKEMFYEGTPVVNGSIEMSTYEQFDSVSSTTLHCDENGQSKITITPQATHKDNWFPYEFYLDFTSTEFQKDYNSIRNSFVFFPRDCMLELSSETEESGVFLINADLHAITLKHFKGIMSNYDSFRGEPIDAQAMTVTIKETYYEKIYLGQTYDYINRVTHDKYDYRRVENILSTENVTTDENGHFSVEFTKPVEDRSYTFEFTTQDKQGQKIIQSVYCGDTTHYYSDEFIIDTNKSQYKVNDTVTAKICSNNQEVIDTDNNCTLFITCKEGFISYDVRDDLKTSFTFDDKYISNAYIIGIYFDGRDLIQLRSRGIYFDDSSEALNIELTTNQVDYKPGDSVDLKVKVTDINGNPVKSDVNISVVDEAFLALYDDYSQPLKELYEYAFKSGILRNVTFKAGNYDFGNAAEKGGGSDFQLRDEFDNTAYFDTITTNNDGMSTVSFNIPDSLTSWRITASAFTKDLKAGKNTVNINCKLPFFLTDVLFDTYLSQDEISATLITSGSDVKENMLITYCVTVEDEDGNATENTVESKGLRYINVPLGKLDAGTYKVTLTAESGEYSDGIQKTIDVVDTQQYFELTQKDNLVKDIDFVSNNNLVKLTFLNEDAANNYEQILNIYHQLSSNRIDLKATAFTAGNYLNEIYDSGLSLDFINQFRTSIMDKLLSEEDIYSLANLSSVDHQVIPCFLLSDFYKNHKNWFTEEDITKMVAYLKGQMNSQETISENNFASIWSLSIMNQPVLLEAYKALESDAFLEEELNYEKLYTLLSLVELGDLENAKSIYSKFKIQYGIGKADTLYMKGEDTRKLTALMMLTAVKLGNMGNADQMYNYLKDRSDYKYPTDMERLQYLIAKKPEHTTCDFVYTLNGKENKVKLDYNDAFHLTLTPEEAEEIDFKEINGNVSVISDFIGTVKQIIPTKGLTVKRTYMVDGNEVDKSNLKQGDIVDVYINVTLPSYIWNYEINDILPAGLSFYDYDINSTHARIDCQGQHINIKGYKQFSQNAVFITYKAIAVAKGSYMADTIVVKNLYSNEANYDEQKTITIH